MRMPNPQIVINKLKKLSKSKKYAVLTFIVLLQLSIAGIVYYTGGIQYVYSHSMYIPIMLAALVFGHKTGIIIEILGGLLLGPFMPINTETGLMQQPINWLLRTFFFMLIGFIGGQFSEHTNTYYLEKIRQLTYLGNTDIFKSEVLSEHIKEISPSLRNEYLLLKLRINNRENLIDVFGTDAYLQLLSELSSIIQNNLTDIIGVYSRNLDGLLVCFHQKHQEEYLDKLLKISQKSYDMMQVQIFIKMTIGITELNEDINESINQSSVASNDAFNEQLHYKFYQGEITLKSRNLEILGSVNQSLKDDDFHLVFQPKVDVKTQQCVGAECLIRWDHPRFGKLSPIDFIPLVENTNLINTMTEWIVKKVLTKLEQYRDVFDAKKYPIAINLSTANLSPDHQLYKSIIHMLQQFDLGEHVIQFEITESLLMKNPMDSIAVIKSLQENHISFSIDDFGTGFSSFEYLSQFGVTEIKIDRVFIHKMLSSDSDLSLVKAMINLANLLQIKTVAEGVESREEAEMLRELNCDYAQGYYFAKPMPFDDLLVFIQNEQIKH